MKSPGGEEIRVQVEAAWSVIMGVTCVRGRRGGAESGLWAAAVEPRGQAQGE